MRRPLSQDSIVSLCIALASYSGVLLENQQKLCIGYMNGHQTLAAHVGSMKRLVFLYES